MINELLPQCRRLEGDEQLEDFYRVPLAAHLRVNFISSLDGAVEIEGRSGALGGPADRAAFMVMRGLADVIMVGAGTARAEDYGPVRLGNGTLARRAARGQAAIPPLAVVTERGDLSPSARLFAPGGRVLVLTTETVSASRPDLASVAEVVPCGRTTVDMESALGQLRDRGYGHILCEGGPGLTRTLLVSDLVDELCLTVSPMLAGAGRRLVGTEALVAQRRFRLSGLLEADDMLLARYEARRPS